MAASLAPVHTRFSCKLWRGCQTAAYGLQALAQSTMFAHKRIDELLHLQNTTFLQLQSLQEW